MTDRPEEKPIGPEDGDSLIAQHLRAFESLDSHEEAPSQKAELRIPAGSNSPRQPIQGSIALDKWLPWCLAGLLFVFAISRTATRTVAIPAASPSPGPSSRSDDSSRLLSELLASPSTAAATSELQSDWASADPIATLSAFEHMAAISKALSGRADPFWGLLAKTPKASDFKLPPPPPPPPPAPIRRIVYRPPPPMRTPDPPTMARVVGVVEVGEPVALIEVERLGNTVKRRLKRGDTLTDGYQIAQITPQSLTVQAASRRRIEIRVGQQVALPTIATSSGIATR
ncbi:MAG: hypothetical protein KGR26_05685 [Cyanobacteria bacterium REEB65]|nr:hypothetical protein [Cyanobacteria bacterium REEB65]